MTVLKLMMEETLVNNSGTSWEQVFSCWIVVLFKINPWFATENSLGLGAIVLGKTKELFRFFSKKEGKKSLMEYTMHTMNDIKLS